MEFLSPVAEAELENFINQEIVNFPPLFRLHDLAKPLQPHGMSTPPKEPPGILGSVNSPPVEETITVNPNKKRRLRPSFIEQNEEEIATPTRKKRKTPIWEIFYRSGNDSFGNMKATCRLCGEIVVSLAPSTSWLHKHLEKSHKGCRLYGNNPTYLQLLAEAEKNPKLLPLTQNSQPDEENSEETEDEQEEPLLRSGKSPFTIFPHRRKEDQEYSPKDGIRPHSRRKPVKKKSPKFKAILQPVEVAPSTSPLDLRGKAWESNKKLAAYQKKPSSADAVSSQERKPSQQASEATLTLQTTPLSSGSTVDFPLTQKQDGYDEDTASEPCSQQEDEIFSENQPDTEKIAETPQKYVATSIPFLTEETAAIENSFSIKKRKRRKGSVEKAKEAKEAEKKRELGKDYVTMMICSGLTGLNQLKNKWFIKLCDLMKLQAPSKKEMEEKFIKKIKNQMENAIASVSGSPILSFTAFIYSNNQLENYLAISSFYFNENWEAETTFLGYFPCLVNFDGLVSALEVKRILLSLEKYKIFPFRVGSSLTMEKCAANACFLDTTKISVISSVSGVFSQGILRFLKQNVIKSMLKRLNFIVRSILFSDEKTEKLQRVWGGIYLTDYKKLKISKKHQWRSIFKAIDAFIPQWEFILDLFSSPEEFGEFSRIFFDVSEFSLLNQIQIILSPFFELFSLLKLKNTAPIPSIVPSLCTLVDFYHRKHENELNEMEILFKKYSIPVFKEYLLKQLDNEAVLAICSLDIRFSDFSWIKFDAFDIVRCQNLAETFLLEKVKYFSCAFSEQQLRDEIELFRKVKQPEPLEMGNSTFNCVEWWKRKGSEFPALCMVVQSCLMTPITSDERSTLKALGTCQKRKISLDQRLIANNENVFEFDFSILQPSPTL